MLVCSVVLHSGLQPYILGKPLRYLILFIVVTGNIWVVFDLIQRAQLEAVRSVTSA